MKRKIKNRTVGLKLNTKIHTRIGIASFILAIISFVFVIIAVYISATMNMERELNIYLVGVFEVMAFILSLLGIGLGIVGEFTVETIKRFAHIGLCVNSVLLIFHIVIISAGY